MNAREKYRLVVSALGSVLIFLFPLGVANAQEGDGGGDAASRTIEEILVTARKREESLLEIPESLAVITGETIDRGNIKGLEQIGFQVPNLNLSMRLDGFPNVSIRGVGSFGNTQGVGFYLDDTQIFSDASSRFGDLARIEVLKGPQGTLYGGSNVGGAVKFVSVRPNSEETTGKIKLLAGEQGTADGEVHVNLPLGDAGWAVRGFAFGASDDGYLKNENPPRANGLRGDNPSEYGDVDESGGRVSIAGPLSDRLSLYASFRYNEFEGPNNTWVRELNPHNLRHPNIVNNSTPGHHERDTKAGLIELTLELEGMDVLWLSSYTDTFSSRYTDIDIREEFLFDLLRPEEMKVTTHELRFTSTGEGALEWIAGVYHSKFEEVMNGYVWWFDTVQNPDGSYSGNAAFLFGSEDNSGHWWGDVPDPARELMTVRTPAELRDRDKTHLAAFGSMTYEVGDWEWGAGLRVDKWENKTVNRDSQITAGQENTEILPRVSLTRWMSEDAMVYGLVAWGYEPGGFNLTSFLDGTGLIPFGREEVLTYEVGWKGRWADGRATASLAAFFIEYEDRQIEYHLVQPDGTAIEAITNFGDSEQYGIEADLSVRVTDELSLTLVAGMIEAEWIEASFQVPGGDLQDLSGKSPPVTPDFSWGASLDYRRPINNRVEFMAALQISHNGEYEGLQAWNPVTNPSFTIVNGQLGFLWENMELMFHMENLTDEGYYNDVQHFINGHDLIGIRGGPGDIVIGTLGQPRLSTVSLTYYF